MGRFFERGNEVRRMDSILATLSPTPLGDVPDGVEVQILEVQSGQALRSRLACLGFLPGARLRVIQNTRHGPVLVVVRSSRVALGRGEAGRILVQPVPLKNDGS